MKRQLFRFTLFLLICLSIRLTATAQTVDLPDPTLTIYDQSGRIVRTLDVGHQIAAIYESQSKAASWDGRNELGERVASGIYFYHLSAGDSSITRRMIILR